MGQRIRISAVTVLVALAAVVGVEGARSDVPNLPWTSYLPPVATAKNPQPGPVATCQTPTKLCIKRQIRRLRSSRDQFGCDHRAVFSTTYHMLTKQLYADVLDGRVKREYQSPRYLYSEDALFANVYFRAIRTYEDGGKVARAWEIAFETAKRDNTGAVQDMLLGINAHVQNDMPFVLAHLGLRDKQGNSRKPDHDIANGALNRAYEEVVAEVKRRFDPAIETTNPTASPLDDLAGLELVRTWRENVWRNAERLLNADGRDERRQVAQSIEDNAAATAQTIAAGGIPGYGATRDAYCAAGPSGE